MKNLFNNNKEIFESMIKSEFNNLNGNNVSKINDYFIKDENISVSNFYNTNFKDKFPKNDGPKDIYLNKI